MPRDPLHHVAESKHRDERKADAVVAGAAALISSVAYLATGDNRFGLSLVAVLALGYVMEWVSRHRGS